MPTGKPIKWLGSSKKDLADFPEEVEDEVGYALWQVEEGRRPARAKPLRGYGGASVLEICEDFDTDTYRVVYTVEYEEAIYVVQSYKKKSKKDSEVPRNDQRIIDARLKVAAEEHRKWLKEQNK
jgi:phage-related protein